MTRVVGLVCVLLVSGPTVAARQAAPAPAPVVFFTIFGPDGARLQRFYTEVFGWPMTADGTVTTAAPAPFTGQIGEDLKNPAVTILYIGVSDVTATLARVKASGGSIQYPRFEVPGRVVLGVFRDPAGNQVGLVEMENGKPKVPEAK